jgi:glycosyltransferase involved in cell wall biosynthesis
VIKLKKKRKMIKILFVNRPDSIEKKGGDYFTMLETMKYVEKSGFNVSSLLDYPPKDTKIDVDLIHIFNLGTARFTYEWVKYAKKYKIPIVLSTIYWKRNPFKDKKLVNIFSLDKWARKEYIRSFFSPLEKFQEKYIIQKKIVEEVDFLITYTFLEKKLIKEKFNVNIDNKTEIIHHGIDEDKFPEVLENNKRNLILQVGAIGPGKNQLSTIKATLNLEIPVYFIGRIEDKEYYNYCKEIAVKSKNIFFIPEISHSEVIDFFKKAKVHVLPSLKEVIPRVNLEASAMGCNIVTTTESYEREIYGEDAWYCKPYDIKNLRKCILEAYNSPLNMKLANKIRSEYTRKKAVEKLIKFYIKISKYEG